jgi:hypothetical protein
MAEERLGEVREKLRRCLEWRGNVDTKWVQEDPVFVLSAIQKYRTQKGCPVWSKDVPNVEQKC